MKILWLTWKDGENPLAGGAEVVNEQLAKRLAADGHEVQFVVGGFAGAKPTAQRDGYTITRVGGRYSVYWHAMKHYKRELRNWPDLVIDEINTIPFFASLYVKQPVVLFVHQLCREIWFYQLPIPLGLIGYLLEPFYLWLLRNNRVITVSDSTEHDLLRYGFKADQIDIISEGIELTPVADLKKIKKFDQPTLLSLGSVRPMKRTIHQLRAFEIAKRSMPDLQFKIAGDASGVYGQQFLKAVAASPYAADIEYLGRVSQAQKVRLMQKSHAIAVTSVKEGWGLIVTEAASQGTPAAVYNIDGLRDSVRHEQTGFVTKRNTPEELARQVIVLLSNEKTYMTMRKSAWQWVTREITFERSYSQFIAQLMKAQGDGR